MINVVEALMIIGSFLVAIVLHECSHALAASWLGDKTPISEGRLSFRLGSHIDPLGTLMCVLLAFQPVLGIGLGWGKPVKPDPWKMRVGANTGVMLVAWAGPVASLLIGIVVSLIVHFLGMILPVDIVTIHILQLLVIFASVNICLALVNLIPLYPLDGYQILYTLLPSHRAVQFARSAPYGPIIILALFFLLPFLGQLSPGLSTFPLFRLAYYIWLGSISIIGLVTGLDVSILYILP